jgi:hypothetical protein
MMQKGENNIKMKMKNAQRKGRGNSWAKELKRYMDNITKENQKIKR